MPNNEPTPIKPSAKRIAAMLLTTIGALWAGLTGLCNFGLLMVSLEVLFDPLVVGIMLFVFLPGAALLFIGIILLKETSQKGPD